MPTPWFVVVKVANFLLTKNTCHPINSILYWSPGHSLHGGLDLVDPFKKAKGGFTHIFIVVDKFTKWVEVKPAASITTAKVMEFISEIMHQFRVPNNIITDNGTQCMARKFKYFCADARIKINYALVSHPQSNGQAEWSNGMILQGLNSRIFNRLMPYARSG
jgi:IS30 family transposase